jgi:iron(III) transport system permease protein
MFWVMNHRRLCVALMLALVMSGLVLAGTTTRSLGLLANTCALALAVATLSLPLAICLAVALQRYRIPGRVVWEACLLVLLFLPLYTQLAAWEAGFGRAGWYSTVFAEKLSAPPLAGFRGAVWVHAMAAVPWLYWLIRLGLQSVPAELEQAARLDGTSWQVWTRITLPLALPTLVAGTLLVGISVASEITVTDFYQFRTYAEELYNGFVLGTVWSRLPGRIAPGLVVSVCLAAAGFAICRLLRPATISADRSCRYAAAGRGRWWALALVVFVVSLILLTPLANLVYQAGIQVRQDGDQRVRSWSAAKLASILCRSPLRFASEFAWSALLGQMSAGGAVAAAVACAIWAHARRGRQAFCAVLGVVCFVAPGPFIGLGIIWLLRWPDSPLLDWLYADTVFAPWLALTVKSFPLAYLVISYGRQSVPPWSVESAQLDAASRWAVVRHVILPQMVPSVICGGLIALAVSVSDVSASVMVLPAGVDTVASRIFNLVHYGADDELAGLCLTWMGLMATLAFAARLAFATVARGRFGRLA